jgi:hypothetical protein
MSWGNYVMKPLGAALHFIERVARARKDAGNAAFRDWARRELIMAPREYRYVAASP